MKRLAWPAAFALAACAASAPRLGRDEAELAAHERLESTLRDPEQVKALADELAVSCRVWARARPDDLKRGVELYRRARDGRGLKDQQVVEILARRPFTKSLIERECGEAFAAEYFKRLAEGFLPPPHFFSPTPDTITPEPVDATIRPDPTGSDIPQEPFDATIPREPR